MQARFRVDDDTWPPDQPKNFTPLVLIQYKGHHNLQQAMAITKLTQTGHIASLASNLPVAEDNQLLQEVLHNSTVTKEIKQILAPLEMNHEPPFILIEGPPGIGKSVLLKEIAYQWSDEQILKTFTFVLLICLRDPIMQQATSIHDLLLLYSKGHKNAPQIADACNDYFFENGGKDIMFLFDGYDEFPDHLQRNSLFSDILKRQLLPDCGLIVSSRPHASENLRKHATLRVDILGFTEIERFSFIQQALKEQPHKIEELTMYLDSHVTINSLCFIPFNIVILIYLCKQGMSLPRNSTELYNYFICLTICRYLAKSGYPLDNTITDLVSLPDPYNTIINQLAKLSFDALSDNKLIFTFDEVKTMCPDITTIPGAINGFGLLQVVQHFGLTGKTMTLNFVHFSIQEFLAAYHITQLPPDEELLELEEFFWSGLHSNMISMYTSLTKGQRPALKQFLLSYDQSGRGAPISQKFLADLSMCLRLFRCYYEAGNEQICKCIQSSRIFDHKCISFVHIRLTPYDVESIALFLTCLTYKKWARISLEYCYIQDLGLYALHRGLVGSNVAVRELRLPYNRFAQSSSPLISELTIHCRVEHLTLDGNDTIGENGALYSVLSHPSSRLVTLKLWGVSLSSAAATILFTALSKSKKLQNLFIGENNISDEACDVIATTMKQNTSLVNFDIYANPISAEAAQCIVESLCLNNTLKLLRLPEYHEDIVKKFKLLQERINEKRSKKNLKLEFGEAAQFTSMFSVAKVL